MTYVYQYVDRRTDVQTPKFVHPSLIPRLGNGTHGRASAAAALGSRSLQTTDRTMARSRLPQKLWLFLAPCFILANIPLSHAFATHASAPSWADLQDKLPSTKHAGPLVIEERELDTTTELADKLVIHVDRNHWCPNCERALLALEVKNAEYVKVLVDDDYSEPDRLPKLKWPDGTVQQGKDMFQILEKIQEQYSDTTPDLYPSISISVDIVRASIERRFEGIMPRYTLPSSLTPFIFLEECALEKDPLSKLGTAEVCRDDDVVQKFKFKVSLEEIDEVLEEYEDGNFIAGEDITAADIYWAPYLERFAAQLPMLYEGLAPRSREFEAVKDWYDDMDQQIPCYSCAVKGRAETWQQLLRNQHPELEFREEIVPNLPTKRSFDANKVWSRYAKDRPYLEETPTKEAAARIVRKYEGWVIAAADACPSVGDADAALRELCVMLCTIDAFDTDAVAEVAANLSGDVREVASFLASEDGYGLAVPKDMGLIPFEALKRVADSAPSPRI